MGQKFENLEAAQESLAATTEELKVAKQERKSYMSEHGLKKGVDYSEDPKHGKKMKSWDKSISTKESRIEETKAYIKENRPKRTPPVREAKYDYPPDMSNADKKKHRAKLRAEAKRAEKGEASGEDKPKKKKKEATAPETPAPEKSSKKDKSEKSEKSDKKKKKEKATADD